MTNRKFRKKITNKTLAIKIVKSDSYLCQKEGIIFIRVKANIEEDISVDIVK